jgi:hypothetical protein
MERAKLNPDFLKKDKLRYEILIRNGGEHSEFKVPQLQKLLQELFSREVNLKTLENIEPVGELQTLLNKLDELEDIVADCITDNLVSTNQHTRICTRLQHLLNRANDLLSRNLLEESNVIKLWELLKQASRLIQIINKLLSKAIVSNAIPQANPTFLQPHLNMLCIEASAAVQNENSISFDSPHVTSPLYVINFDQVHRVSRVATGVISQYAKLSNPIQQLLKGEPILAGDNFDSILQLFKLLLRIKIHSTVLSISDIQILKILYPFTRGTLSDRVLEGISSGLSLQTFHARTLDFFFPRAKSSLEQQHYFRVQRHDESLSDCISDVKLHAEILCLQHSESSVVKTILDGLSSRVRSYICFAQRPTSFHELDRLCVDAANAEYADRLRDLKLDPKQVSQGKSNFQPSRVGETRECLYCHKTGHVITNCPIRPLKKASSSGAVQPRVQGHK